jgi:hypothetical protein
MSTKLIQRVLVLNAILFIVSMLFVREIMPDRSSYSFRLGVLDCNNVKPLEGCRHEIGHKMDDDLGMPSLSEEFAIATQAHVIYKMTMLEVDDMAIFIQVYPDQTPRELYAAIYARVDGDITKLPKSLQRFYSDDPSYLNLYDCLAQTGLNICGRSVSFLRGDTQ